MSRSLADAPMVVNESRWSLSAPKRYRHRPKLLRRGYLLPLTRTYPLFNPHAGPFMDAPVESRRLQPSACYGICQITTVTKASPHIDDGAHFGGEKDPRSMSDEVQVGEQSNAQEDTFVRYQTAART